jgi:hypothetical protein
MLILAMRRRKKDYPFLLLGDKENTVNFWCEEEEEGC